MHPLERREYQGPVWKWMVAIRGWLFPLRLLSWFTIGLEICPKCGFVSKIDVSPFCERNKRSYYVCHRCCKHYFPFRLDM